MDLRWSLCICSLFLIIMIESRIILDYNDLVKLEAACSPEDQCAVGRDDGLDAIPEYRCECKSSCRKFDTCCIDSLYINPKYTAKNKKIHRGSCERVFKSNITTFLVSRCDPRWHGNEIFRSKCETPFKNFRDVVTLKPVTSMKTEITYRNYFCAICNNDARSISSWDVRQSESKGVYLQDLNWDRDKADFSNEVVYIENSNEWGLITEDDDGNKAFVNMNIDVQLPSRLREIVPSCVPNLVSKCNDFWSDEDVRKMCDAYMAIVYLRTDSKSVPVAYRNVHCAICNHASYSKDSICQTYFTSKRSSNPPMSFTLLLDVNLSDGNVVGKKFPCNKGQIFDSHFKKCRTLVCGLPDYVMKDGKCEPPPSKDK